MIGRRERTYPHEKPMGSYILHAWRDAMALANLLQENYSLSEAKSNFEAQEVNALVTMETRNVDVIRDFIAMTEAQRRKYIKLLKKQKVTDSGIMAFIVLAIIGAIRVKEVLELRDQFRHYLVPGMGNRDTAGAIYDFSAQVNAMFDYSWPGEVFDAMGIYIDDED